MNAQFAFVFLVSAVSAVPQVPLGGYPNLNPGLISPSTTTNPLAEPLSTTKPPDMPKDQMNAAPALAAQVVPSTGVPAAPVRPVNPYGPQFFGPGVGNLYAFPPNPVLIQKAKQVTATNPNVRVFVDTTGEVLFTDHFGREVEVVDQFGGDPLEILAPEEQAALFQERTQQAAAQGLLPGGQGFGQGFVPGGGVAAAGATPSRQVGVGATGGFPGFTPIYRVLPAEG